MGTTIKPPPSRSTKGAPPPEHQPSQNLTKPNPERLKHLNFRVPAGFHLAFRSYAARHGISMVELVQRAFQHYSESTK